MTEFTSNSSRVTRVGDRKIQKGEAAKPLKSKAQKARSPSPAALRSMLGANLRQLSRQAKSISALCRELGINRTQYNRYLGGESFPRPDVLHRICSHFGVDARILLEPVDSILFKTHVPELNPAFSDLLRRAASPLSEDLLPSGFYRFTRRCFVLDDVYVQGIITISRQNDLTVIKGFDPKEAVLAQGLEVTQQRREFGGTVIAQDDGFAILVSRRGSATTHFNYLAPIPAPEGHFWLGYTARAARDQETARRVERQTYEFLGPRIKDALPAARLAGLCNPDDLMPCIRSLLRIGEPFQS
ncbi:transcriptional regulator with XRE-family HTH domain [Sagittula marina]|uniref:Transcriptional regulator with XRE-family HTH domain n=1 Tax=Sagittula marina TaxID=943940 RepID=A0A7W6DL28_9RHOB|nr:helix-turn-helix transcriptional regulator [Sagittula marina]MBB3985210.1 transcriptional regulator with XRE-family HTH domain [Sagittula marina]